MKKKRYCSKCEEFTEMDHTTYFDLWICPKCGTAYTDAWWKMGDTQLMQN